MLERSYPPWIHNASPTSHSIVSKISSAKCGIFPYELLAREALDAPQTTQMAAIPLGFQPESESKTLLLRTAHS